MYPDFKSLEKAGILYWKLIDSVFYANCVIQWADTTTGILKEEERIILEGDYFRDTPRPLIVTDCMCFDLLPFPEIDMISKCLN